MIDFIKIFYREKGNHQDYVLQKGNFEQVIGSYDIHSAEEIFPYRSKYKNMDYVVSQKSGYIKNSLHKFYNVITLDQDQNYNDFTYSNLCDSIDLLMNKMVDVDRTCITQLEFGLNISPANSAEEIIKSNVLMHNLSGFNHNRKYYGKGELKQFDYHNFFIKIYDKAKQYDLNKNILRFEIKFIKAKEFQKLGVFNLLDLKDKSVLRKLFIVLLEKFDELTIIDSINDTTKFNEKDRLSLISYMNPRFWENLTEQNKRQSKLRYKRDFERIQQEYNLNQVKLHLRELLIRKFIYLMIN